MVDHRRREWSDILRRSADLPKSRTCGVCGDAFSPIRSNHKYCSPPCRHRATITKHRAKYGRGGSDFVPGSTLICANPECGKEFCQTVVQRKYCSDACAQWHSNRRWEDANPLYNAKRHDLIRREVFTHYGNGKIACTCCGEKEMKFLSIDHINGGGSKHTKSLNRRGVTFYLWLIKQGFPDGYQTLCYNCNFAKGHFGVCPHQE